MNNGGGLYVSIPEKMSMLTPRQRNEFGAEPSREQQRAIDRLHAILSRTREQRHREQLELKRKAVERKERYDIDPPQEPPARQTRVIRYTALGEEMLAAMRGCDPLGVAMVLIQHTQDRSSSPKAFAELCTKAFDLAVERKWRDSDSDIGKDILRSMCRLALLESTEPKCPDCKGRGYGLRGGDCRPCGNTGELRVFDSDRAYAIGVTPDAYRKTHKDRYQWIRSLLLVYEQNTLDRMFENLYGHLPR
jgi:hypothetical protein